MGESSSAAAVSFGEKLAERMKRFRALHATRNEARTQNHQEVVAEDARNKLPANYESLKRHSKLLLQDQKARDEAKAKNINNDQAKLLHVSAIEAEKLERKRKKKNPDEGFSTYEQAKIRQYSRLVKSMPAPNFEYYEKQKQNNNKLILKNKAVFLFRIITLSHFK